MDFLCPKNHPRTVKPGFFRRSPLGCGLCPNKKLIKSRDEFIKIVMEKYNGTVVGEYKGNDVQIECLCKNGHNCYPIPHSVKSGQGICLVCAGQCPKQSREKFINLIKALGGIVIGEYINVHTPVECECEKGHICFPRPSEIQQGGGMCKKCSGHCQEQAKDNFIKSIENIGGKVIGEYIDAHTPVECVCKNNHTCYPYPTNIQRGLGMCLTCAGQNPLEVEKKFINFVIQKGGEIIGKYDGSKTSVHCKCKYGHDCYPTPETLQSYGTFCITCTRIEKESYGEKLIYTVLISLNIEHRREVTPQGLKKLRFDFEFEYGGKVWYIEYDGGQHQKYNKHYHKSEDHFNKYRHRDLLKNYFIRNSQNCVLIRIDHSWEKNKQLQKQSVVEAKLLEHIRCYFLDNNKKIFYDPDMYDWIDDEPNEETINKYLIH
jgi:hypothetical protein